MSGAFKGQASDPLARIASPNSASNFDVFRIVGSIVLLYILYNVAISLVTGFTSPLRHIPGPAWSRFTRLPLKRAIITGKRIFFIDALHQKYGSVVRIAPDEISVSDINGFRQIHSTTNKFNKAIWYEELTIFPRHSVFTMQTGKTHAARRRLFAKGFSKTQLNAHWEPIVAEKAKLAVKGIKTRALADKADLMQWWTFQATDTVGRLGFGESFGMLEKGEKTPYIRTLERALIGNGIGAELPWVRAIGRLVPVKAFQEAFDATDKILAYGQKAVDNAKKQGSDSNLMANVLRESEKDNAALDDLDVRVEATSLIFAGSGTTANTLTYLLWVVLNDPALQAKIEEEVAGLPEGYKDSDTEALPWLNAALQETLRLYCAVPGTLPRIVPANGITVAGQFLPAGTTVGTQAYTMHRLPECFPDPHAFKPERWFPENSETMQGPDAKYAFNAFGAGAYTCLGIHIAYMEMRYAAAEFFRECKGARIAPSQTAELMEPENYFVITPKGHKCEITLRS